MNQRISPFLAFRGYNETLMTGHAKILDLLDSGSDPWKPHWHAWVKQSVWLALMDFWLSNPVQALCSLLELKKSYFKITKSFKYHFSSELITVQQGQVFWVLENVKRIDNNKQCQSWEGTWTALGVRYFCLINFKWKIKFASLFYI